MRYIPFIKHSNYINTILSEEKSFQSVYCTCLNIWFKNLTPHRIFRGSAQKNEENAAHYTERQEVSFMDQGNDKGWKKFQ